MTSPVGSLQQERDGQISFVRNTGGCCGLWFGSVLVYGENLMLIFRRHHWSRCTVTSAALKVTLGNTLMTFDIRFD